MIDVAIGILAGLRGCSEQEAFDDLVAAVHDTGIAPGCFGPCPDGHGRGL